MYFVSILQLCSKLPTITKQNQCLSISMYASTFSPPSPVNDNQHVTSLCSPDCDCRLLSDMYQLNHIPTQNNSEMRINTEFVRRFNILSSVSFEINPFQSDLSQDTQTQCNKYERTEESHFQKCVAAPRRICIPRAIAIFLAFLPLEAEYG